MAMRDATPAVEREKAVSLSPWGWMVIIFKAICITFGLIWKALRAAFGGEKNGHSLKDYVLYEGMRDYQSGLNAVGVQNLLPGTVWTSVWFAKRHHLPYAKLHLSDGTTAVRIGPGRVRKAVMFCHGGGYMAPALPQHIDFAFGFAKKPAKDVTVFVLPYALASDEANRYPRQLQQAASLLDYLLHSEGISPSDITLVGDSAGAHLTLTLLLHLRHPNPQVSPVTMEGSLSGAGLISPWIINPNSTSPSITANRPVDILDADALNYWAHNLLGTAEPDYWNCPLTIPPEYLRDLPVDNILVTYGDNETLKDDAARFCDMLKAEHPCVTVMNFPGELHVHMVMNRFLLINKPCESERVYVEWLQKQTASSTAVAQEEEKDDGNRNRESATEPV